MIGIKASCAEDKLAHKVKDYFVINGNSYELYSRELLYSLSQLNLSWEKFNIFRLEGNIYPDKKIALFPWITSSQNCHNQNSNQK